MQWDFDILVAGGGHAGIEAVHAGWKMGLKAALVTLDPMAIGRMSCNPAIGGVGKGQIVRDIDALGGLMGQLADATGIQFRMLNESKGPAVWGPRCQSDMFEYSKLARETLEALPGLEIIGGELVDLQKIDNGWKVQVSGAGEFKARTVIITSGTFLNSKMYTGLESAIGGRVGEPSATQLSLRLASMGIALRRLKTGTPSRLDPDSIDYSLCEVQHGDQEPFAFSSRTVLPLQNKAVCWITRTTLRTHEILREGFAQSPMFTGVIQGLGPRYCPSIEDKINRFSDKDSHQLFLEPEGLNQGRIYVNGFSSSLPSEIQEKALRSIPGLENCRILQIGYAVEYDSVDATQLDPTLQCTAHPGLWFAGQVCGTSGYEEAAGQGLIAGINAALQVQGKEPWIPGRSESYIGVMLDDLTAVTLDEPYRMFTSRAEYRLFLRHDNAEMRLIHHGRQLGMVEDSAWERFESSQKRIGQVREWLATHSPDMETANGLLANAGQNPLVERARWIQLLRRPGVDVEAVLRTAQPEPMPTRMEWLHILAEELYRGFYERQLKDIEQQRKMENFRLSPDLDYKSIKALSFESRQKLSAKRPLTLGQAARIPGVRPADIQVLIHWFNQGATES